MPGIGRSSGRPPRLRTHLSVLVTGMLVAVGLIATATPATADPPTGGTPIIQEPFTGSTVADGNWNALGDACLTAAAAAPAARGLGACTHKNQPPGGVAYGVTPGYLQLTDVDNFRAGSVLYDKPIPASAGVNIQFDQYQYGGSGADGIGFFLVDGSTSLTDTGANGGSLGYAQRDRAGVVGGFLGVGLDAYGNFFDDGENRGTNCPLDQRSPSTSTGPIAPNVISLRGPGSGMDGYCLLGTGIGAARRIASTVPQPVTKPNAPGTTLNGGQGTLRAAALAASKRSINIVVQPLTMSNPTPHVVVQVRYVDNGPWITELDFPAPPNIPSTYKFGLSASTGGSTDVHLIRGAIIKTVDPLPRLQLEKQVDRTSGTPLPAIITAGTVIPYQYTVTNVGIPVNTLTISDDHIATSAIICAATSLTTAPLPGSSTVCKGSYTVTAADVAAGSVVNIATAGARAGGVDIPPSPPATVTVPLVSQMTIAKSITTPAPYAIGQLATYQFALTNTGGTDLTTLVVSDDRITTPIICATGTLTPGQSTTCTGSHIIQLAQLNGAGLLVNSASVTAKTPFGQTVTAGPATASVPISVDIGVTKTVDDVTPVVGTDVNFTITATNNGPSAATGVVLTDVVPDGDPVGSVVYVSSTPAAGTTYDPTTGAWAIPSVAVGATYTLGIRATVNTSRAFTNSVSRTKTNEPDRNPANDQASVTLNPITPTADLAVAKSVDAPVILLGDTATFTVSVRNLGPFAATGVQVGDDIPVGLTLASTAGDGSYDAATGTWTVGALGVDASATRAFTVTGNTAGTYTNLASITGTPSPPDTNPTNNSATAQLSVRTPVADLSIVKTPFPQQGVIGEVITYQLSATNLGPDPSREVSVADVWPAGLSILTADASTGPLTITPDGKTWTIGALAVGQVETATVTARLTAPGTQVNTATITSPIVIDPDPTNNSSSATVTSAQPDLDIAVGKTVRAERASDPILEVPVGHNAIFTLTAFNDPARGSVAATDLQLTDQLPDGLTYVSSSGTGTYDPVTHIWDIGTLASGSTARIEVTVTVSKPGDWVNTVSLSRLTQTDVDPTNNSASADVIGVLRADLAITKTVSPSVGQPGQTVQYTVTVTNNGPNDAVGVEASDPAIIAATISGFVAPPGTTFDATTRVWNIPALANGQSLDLTVDVTLSAVARGWYRNYVVVNSLTPDTDPSDNLAFADLFVPAADIAVTKTVDKAVVFVGDLVTFTINLTNYGPDPAQGVTLSDRLPTGLAFVSATPSVGTYDPASGLWNAGDLKSTNAGVPAGGQATLVIVARADVARAAPYTNVATSDRRGSFPYDPDLTNNTDQAKVQVDPLPTQLTLTKNVSQPRVVAGSGVTYTLVVGNLGPAVATDVVLIDPFPAGVHPTAVRGTGCTISAQDVDCSLGDLAVNATQTIEVDAVVSVAGGFVNTATVTTTTPPIDPDPVQASALVEAVAPVVPPIPDHGTGLAQSGVDPWVPLGAAAASLLLGLLLLVTRRRRREG